MHILGKMGLFILAGLLFAGVAWAAKPLEELSAAEAAAMIKNGEITSEELVTALLQRIEATQNLNAFISLDPQSAIKAARAADLAVKQGRPLGKLHGVPIAVKDNIDAAGFPTTAGTRGMFKIEPGKDAAMVAMLKAQGAIVVGKTNMHELGFGIICDNAYFGAVRNPYNPDYITGGSSGGNAAALAAKLIPLAIGSDTGGSIRIPAGLCGVYGYRPSVGRYSTQGFVPMASTKDVVGPMARTAYDLILTDAILNGYEPDTIKPLNLQGLRIGIPGYPLWQNLDEETAKVMETVLAKLEAAGVVLVRANLDLPDIFNINRYADFYIVLHECRRDFPVYLKSYGLTVTGVAAQIADQDIKRYFNEILLSPVIQSGTRYADVMLNQRAQMITAWEQYFAVNRVDFILSPTTILPARPLANSKHNVELNGANISTETAYLQNTSLSSNAGMAGVSMPAGFTAQGLPVGLEIDVLSGNDIALLSLVLSLEKVLQSPKLEK